MYRAIKSEAEIAALLIPSNACKKSLSLLEEFFLFATLEVSLFDLRENSIG
jgi:hypothetical protein